MKHEITVPEVSEGVSEGTVVAISVEVGDSVTEDQTLLELETDKAVIDIPSPFAGKITGIKVAEGDNVAIGAVIMVIESAGSPAEEPRQNASQADLQVEPEPEVEPESASEQDQEPAAPTKVASAGAVVAEPIVDLSSIRRGDEVVPAAPSIRRQARELGVDIYQVEGSGPGGRISAEDVKSYVRETMQRISGVSPALATNGSDKQRPLPDFSKWGKISSEPLSRVRELTADAMSYAWSTIPMVTQYDRARIDELENFRKEFNSKVGVKARLTMTAILVKICAAALKLYPQFNSSLDLENRQLILKQYVHVGVAVDTPAGLLVPVLRNVDEKGVEELADELDEIAAKSRQRKISPADLEGGTFTISNLGGIGGSSFTPIVYSPQVAILGVSRAEQQLVWDGEQFVPGLVLPLALTYDHRVIDGADGARFLRWICQTIENPFQLVMKGS